MRKFFAALTIVFFSFIGGVFAQTLGGSVLRAVAVPVGYIYSTVLSSAPTSAGNWNSIVTAFTGDLTHVSFPVSAQITGTATLGQPTSGYSYTYEAYPFATYLYNSSGWNNDTASNTGRTAAVDFHSHVYQAGQGDAVAFNASCFVASSRAGATNWLAEPACVLFNGGATAGATGAYLNLTEFDCNDAGFDAACIGVVANLTRTVSTAALGQIWDGVRVQSKGAASIDAVIAGTGNITNGMDLSAATVAGAPIIVPLLTPSSQTATCTTGSIKWDTTQIYICTTTNHWKRAALSDTPF